MCFDKKSYSLFSWTLIMTQRGIEISKEFSDEDSYITKGLLTKEEDQYLKVDYWQGQLKLKEKLKLKKIKIRTAIIMTLFFPLLWHLPLEIFLGWDMKTKVVMLWWLEPPRTLRNPRRNLMSSRTPSQSHKDIPSLESLKRHFWVKSWKQK